MILIAFICIKQVLTTVLQNYHVYLQESQILLVYSFIIAKVTHIFAKILCNE